MDALAVAAAVVVVGAVERLMHIADEMDDKHEGFALLYWSGRGVAQNRLEVRNFGDDAIVFGAVAGHVEVAIGDLNIDEVPGAGFGPAAAYIVGPTGDRRERLVGPEESEHSGAGGGGELFRRLCGRSGCGLRCPSRAGMERGQGGGGEYA